jgi:hypothetical protein
MHLPSAAGGLGTLQLPAAWRRYSGRRRWEQQARGRWWLRRSWGPVAPPLEAGRTARGGRARRRAGEGGREGGGGREDGRVGEGGGGGDGAVGGGGGGAM